MPLYYECFHSIAHVLGFYSALNMRINLITKQRDMKKTLFIPTILALVALDVQALDLKDQKQKQSYLVGRQFGSSLKQQGFEIDVNVLKQSVQDAFDGKPDLLSKEEAGKVMNAMRESAMKKQKAVADTNLKTQKEFFAKNEKAKGVVKTKSGLQYMVIKEGSGAKPKATDKVKVHYKGTLLDGKEFDSSYKRNAPAEFPLNRVIKGWTEGIPLMTKGSKYKFFVPSELAYGPGGRPGIPPNSALVFEVELLEIL